MYEVMLIDIITGSSARFMQVITSTGQFLNALKCVHAFSHSSDQMINAIYQSHIYNRDQLPAHATVV